MPPMFRVPERTSIEPRNDTNHMALCLESGTYEEVKEYLERNGCIVRAGPETTAAFTSTTPTAIVCGPCILEGVGRKAYTEGSKPKAK